VQTCALSVPGSQAVVKFHFSFGNFVSAKWGSIQAQRVYALHPVAQAVDAGDVSWEMRSRLNASSPELHAKVIPQVISRHSIGNLELTVLESESPVQGPVLVDGQTCKPYE
jgi:hypothetical protein